MSLLHVAEVVKVRCHYCNRSWPPSEVITTGEATKICCYCHEKHLQAVLAFAPPHECMVCHRTFEQISAATPGNEVHMTAHWKDGIYQILCATCDADYVQKRRDQFGDTPFGWERGLK